MQFLDGYCQEPFFAKNSSNFINAFPRRSDVHTTISPFFPASLYKTTERTNWTWKLFESPKGSYFTKNANIQPDFLFPFDDHHFLTSFASFGEEVKMKKYAVHTLAKSRESFLFFMYGRRQNVIIKASHWSKCPINLTLFYLTYKSVVLCMYESSTYGWKNSIFYGSSSARAWSLVSHYKEKVLTQLANRKVLRKCLIKV